jgi:hypothetical protein
MRIAAWLGVARFRDQSDGLEECRSGSKCCSKGIKAALSSNATREVSHVAFKSTFPAQRAVNKMGQHRGSRDPRSFEPNDRRNYRGMPQILLK